MSPSLLRPLQALLALGALAALAQGPVELDAGALALLPPLVLFLPLLAGRYLGEKQLERLVRRPRTASYARAVDAPTPRAPRATSGQRGRPLASRLAGRAPPRASVA